MSAWEGRTHAEEREAGLRENGVGEDEGNLDDEGRQAVGEHVAKEGARRLGAQRPRRGHVLHLPRHQD
jgi:hypothetical protein